MQENIHQKAKEFDGEVDEEEEDSEENNQPNNVSLEELKGQQQQKNLNNAEQQDNAIIQNFQQISLEDCKNPELKKQLLHGAMQKISQINETQITDLQKKANQLEQNLTTNFDKISDIKDQIEETQKDKYQTVFNQIPNYLSKLNNLNGRIKEISELILVLKQQQQQ